jgi:3-phenylpropionate/trans-cinnamate dioxygenase ferredoxin reductase subunit
MAGKSSTLVIAGASYAGVQLAASARELGFEERIVMIGDESHAPYQRPPLSKGLLTGKTTLDQLPLRGPEFFQQNDIELLLGHRVTSLDASTRVVTLSDGAKIDYAWAALATGARCRSLSIPGADLERVFRLRTLDDALQIGDASRTSQRACVIGGGFIGLEVASALRARGTHVTVIEAQPRLLMRSFPQQMSAYVEQSHTSRGVQMMTGRGVSKLHALDNRVGGVELEDGTLLDCDMVVLGIGVEPNSELAHHAGLIVDNGIHVDMLGRTSNPKVLAIGDVANMSLPPTPGGLSRIRLESIQAANDGARAAASLLVGHENPCTSVPWFWSDQFDMKFQMAGLPQPGDQIVLRGEMSADRFTVFYLRDRTLVAAHSVNRPAEHMLSRKLIGARTQFLPKQLEDESFDLKAALASTSPTASS